MTVRSGDETDPLVHFEVSWIPSNARIVAAKVGMFSSAAQLRTSVRNRAAGLHQPSVVSKKKPLLNGVGGR